MSDAESKDARSTSSEGPQNDHKRLNAENIKEMNHYQVLGVEPTASHDEIRKAYKKVALETHPDKGGDKEIFQIVSLAHEVLENDKKRTQYDMDIAPRSSRVEKPKEAHASNSETIETNVAKQKGLQTNEAVILTNPRERADVRGADQGAGSLGSTTPKTEPKPKMTEENATEVISNSKVGDALRNLAVKTKATVAERSEGAGSLGSTTPKAEPKPKMTEENATEVISNSKVGDALRNLAVKTKATVAERSEGAQEQSPLQQRKTEVEKKSMLTGVGDAITGAANFAKEKVVDPLVNAAKKGVTAVGNMMGFGKNAEEGKDKQSQGESNRKDMAMGMMTGLAGLAMLALLVIGGPVLALLGAGAGAMMVAAYNSQGKKTDRDTQSISRGSVQEKEQGQAKAPEVTIEKVMDRLNNIEAKVDGLDRALNEVNKDPNLRKGLEAVETGEGKGGPPNSSIADPEKAKAEVKDKNTLGKG